MSKKTAPKAIVGPLISDIRGVEGGNVTIATAFYTAGALNALTLKATELRLLVRLNTHSVADWAAGSVDPVALSTFIRRHQKTCSDVSLFIHSAAHAKIYSGERSYLVGSANLSTRALSGSAAEILWLENDDHRRTAMAKGVNEYAHNFTRMSLAQLDEYIFKNEAKAKELAKKIPKFLRFHEDRLPKNITRPSRLGDYDHFLQWLQRQHSAAASEVLARARGKSQLSGHIRQAFFGTRQFFLGDPQALTVFSKVNPDAYSFSRDAKTVSALGAFVGKHAHEEGPFTPSRWQNYLPIKAGGKQARGGATVGNLNRMLPLMARYLQSKIGVKS